MFGHQAPAGTLGPSPWLEVQALTRALQGAMACQRCCCWCWGCDWEAVPGPCRRSPVPRGAEQGGSWWPRSREPEIRSNPGLMGCSREADGGGMFTDRTHTDGARARALSPEVSPASRAGGLGGAAGSGRKASRRQSPSLGTRWG